MELCDLCLAGGGRFNAKLECCQLRLLAGAPAHNRKAVYERLQQAEGVKAVADLKAKVRAEFQRRQDKERADQKREHEQRTAAGRLAAAALLKQIKDKSMNISPLERATAQAREYA